MSKISVIVVDDSTFIRQMFSQYLSEDPQIEVVATAHDPIDAREKIKKHNPDVITLDIEMPKMDGLTFLEKIMTLRPMPVVMASSLTQRGAESTIRALEIGAVDYIGKPASSKELESIKPELIRKVKAAARIKVRPRSKRNTTKATTLSYTGDASRHLIAIGASTGGVEAIREVLEKIPANAPPIVITQHMPPIFTASFASRLNSIVAPTVVEAADRMPIEPGHVYIAAGSHHLLIHKSAGQLVCKLDDGPPVSSHKPSVDVMFESIVESAADRTVAAIFTGMGRDGARGMLALSEAGVATFAQDEASCVVFGMPKAAIEEGGAQKVLPLCDMAQALLNSTK